MSASVPISKSLLEAQIEPASRPLGEPARIRKDRRDQAARLPKKPCLEGAKAPLRTEDAASVTRLSSSIEERKGMSWEKIFVLWDSLGAADFEFERQVSYSLERDFF